MSYAAIVCRLQNVRKHPNADRLQLANVCGEQVIVGLDNKEGDLGLYFPTDGQLSLEFAAAHDLIQRVDADGKRAGGFFSKNRHVRSQNFRGMRGYGFWMPVSCLEFTGGDVPNEGDEISVWNGVPICNKYITPATLKAAGGLSRGMARKNNVNFPEHIETRHFAKSEKLFTRDSVVYVTEKLHGTSQRVGYVLEDVEQPRTLLDRLLRRTRVKQEWKHLIGTRRVVLKDHNEPGFYGSNEFRYNCVANWISRLKQGEVVYGEVVGYTESGKPIMAPHSTADVPEYARVFGNVITYHYGCPENTCKFYAYRITQHGVELSWDQVRRRCAELGVAHVPEVERFIVWDATHSTDVDEVSALTPEHPTEGVVYRIENTSGVEWVKEKTYEFGVMEGYLKSKDTYVDTEEAA